MEKVVYPLLVTDRLLDLERQMSGPDASSASARRGWVFANALSFLEGGYYGDGQDEVARESGWHRRGAVFGMRRAGSSANPTWPWYVPIAGSISREELVEGFRIEPKTAAVLDPAGKPFVAGGSGDAEDMSSPCSRARADARADSPASTRLIELLALPIAADDRAGIERRVGELTTLFTSLDPGQRSALRADASPTPATRSVASSTASSTTRPAGASAPCSTGLHRRRHLHPRRRRRPRRTRAGAASTVRSPCWRHGSGSCSPSSTGSTRRGSPP